MASDSAANTPGADSAAATPSATTTTNQVRPGGAPIRRYMNEKIVPHLLDGMTVVAKEQCVYHPHYSSNLIRWSIRELTVSIT